MILAKILEPKQTTARVLLDPSRAACGPSNAVEGFRENGTVTKIYRKVRLIEREAQNMQ